VILSMQLSFAVFPLVMFTNNKHKMGLFANHYGMKITAWIIAVIILVLNAYLVYDWIVN